ncbi:MAG: penicillin-binding transpeptidase domain-containing protein [Fibrobacterota bacterium]
MQYNWRAQLERLRQYRLPRQGRIRRVLLILLCLAAAWALHRALRAPANVEKKKTLCDYPWKPDDIACYLGRKAFDSTLCALDTAVNGTDTLVLRLTVDDTLQRRIWTLMRRYRPRCGAAMVFRPATGEVLAAVSYRNEKDSAYLPDTPNMLLWNGYPAASLIKIVTVGEAMERGLLQPNDALSVSGSFYTLYRSQLKETPARWSRRVTVRDGFARSVNPLFAKIGLHVLGSDRLNKAAERFLFNRPLGFDLPVPASRWIPPADDYATAEAACGFTRATTITPVHAALLAGAACNSGRVSNPYIVRSVDRKGEPFYRHPEDTAFTLVSPATARCLRDLMGEVVIKGTARKGFRQLQKLPCCRGLEMGGKTGSLDAESPKGRCDWFTGFARDPDRPAEGIAVAVVTVHGAFWTVHSSYIASEVIRYCFDKNRKKGR